MMRPLESILIVWVVIDSGLASATGVEPPSPEDIKTAPAPEWNRKFAGVDGWIGGDAAYSVALGRDRVLWLFGDSLLGQARNGRRDGAVLVNNAIGVQGGRRAIDPIRFLSGPLKAGKPTAFLTPSDGKGWLWPQAAFFHGGRLGVFLPQVEKTAEPGAFGFRHVAQWLAEVENPDVEPGRWRMTQRKLPFADFTVKRERSWGSAALLEGEDLYIYGYDEERGQGLGKRRLLVARVSAAKAFDFTAWRFRTADGWSQWAADAAPLADGLATEFSVSRVPGGKGYVLVATEAGLGDRIVGRFAATPAGPWSVPVLLYRCPEMRADKGVFCYAAKAHPWADGDGLLVSYCVNAWEFGRLFRDETVYRPKFVRVQFPANE